MDADLLEWILFNVWKESNPGNDNIIDANLDQKLKAQSSNSRYVDKNSTQEELRRMAAYEDKMRRVPPYLTRSDEAFDPSKTVRKDKFTCFAGPGLTRMIPSPASLANVGDFMSGLWGERSPPKGRRSTVRGGVGRFRRRHHTATWRRSRRQGVATWTVRHVELGRRWGRAERRPPRPPAEGPCGDRP